MTLSVPDTPDHSPDSPDLMAELHRIILTSDYPAWDAYCYARGVLKRRWPEAEHVIMTDAYTAYAYARSVLRRRWPEAEPVIMTNAYSAYNYAHDVLNLDAAQTRRWIKQGV